MGLQGTCWLHWVQARTVEAGGKALSKTFTRRLIWRDLAYWQLHHWPAMAAVPMRPHYAAQVCCPLCA